MNEQKLLIVVYYKCMFTKLDFPNLEKIKVFENMTNFSICAKGRLAKNICLQKTQNEINLDNNNGK